MLRQATLGGLSKLMETDLSTLNFLYQIKRLKDKRRGVFFRGVMIIWDQQIRIPHFGESFEYEISLSFQVSVLSQKSIDTKPCEAKNNRR